MKIKNLSFKNVSGEFYMSISDFTTYFDELDIAHVNLNAFSDLEEEINSNHVQYQHRQYFGYWKKGLNSGDINDKCYWQNSQFYFEVLAKSSFVFALMQPYSAKLRKENSGNFSYYPIKFDIYSVTGGRHDVAASKQNINKKYLQLICSTADEAYGREVSKRCTLKTGHYVIIPSCSDPEANSEYLMRFYFDKFACGAIHKLD